jgi:hypothetical protein
VVVNGQVIAVSQCTELMAGIDEIVKYGSKAEILDLITILSSPIKINQYLI